MTRLGIEFRSPGPLANTLLIRPMAWYKYFSLYFKLLFSKVVEWRPHYSFYIYIYIYIYIFSYSRFEMYIVPYIYIYIYIYMCVCVWDYIELKEHNWQKICNRQFRMWLQYSKLILFKEGKFFIKRASGIWIFGLSYFFLFGIWRSFLWEFLEVGHECVLTCRDVEPVLEKRRIKRLDSRSVSSKKFLFSVNSPATCSSFFVNINVYDSSLCFSFDNPLSQRWILFELKVFGKYIAPF